MMTIKRATADRYIDTLRKNATEINVGDYAYRIDRLEIFGSYLTDKNPIGDLDIMVTLAPAFDNVDRQHAYIVERRRAQPHYLSPIERLLRVQDEVFIHLRRGMRYISFHIEMERQDILAHGGRFCCIYQREQNRVNAQ